MAFTEKYVTVTGAGNHDGTAEAHAWSFAEMIAAAPAAGTRVNIKAGAYSEGVTTLPSNGTAIAPIVLRGYNATIGDLDNQGRGSDGMLNTANMPDVTITGLWTPSDFCVLQNLDITGGLSSYLIGSTAIDNFSIVNCRLVNTANNASAGCFQGDDNNRLVNSDFACTGDSHGIVVDADSANIVIGCRFSCVAAVVLLQLNAGHVSDSVFVGVGDVSVGVGFLFHAAYTIISNSTFYNLGTAIRTANSVAITIVPVVNCHVTDCGKFIDNQYSATSELATIEMNNRQRDNTTPRTGILSAVLAGEVTTDAGGYSTDYVSGTNLRLLYSAAGAGVGMMPYTDIGAYHHVPDFPEVGNVTEDDTVNGATGTFAVPAPEDVEATVQYGAGGTEFTGTLVAGGGGTFMPRPIQVGL